MNRYCNEMKGFFNHHNLSGSVKLSPVLLSVLFLSACSGESAGVGTNSSSGAIDSSVAANLPDGGAAIPPPETPEPDITSEATSFFFSYDESASTASRDLALTSLANGRKPDPSLGRPFEFLNAEQISTTSTDVVGPFNVSMGLLQSENGDIPLTQMPEASVYGLGVGLSGPTLNLESRDNVVLTVLLDISGSMDATYANETENDISTLLDVAKFGLNRMQQSLKPADVVNLVTFATDATVMLEGHSPSPNSMDNVISGIFTDGSTDIENGLNLAYQVANRTYDASKANRVIMITDAFVNTGEIDPEVIASHTVINGFEGIHFSGVGVGSSFNDRVLDTITDAGKGSYSAMITPADANRIFTDGFSRFLSPAVQDVRFQLTYPQELDQLQSFAEEISTEAQDVQPINFSFNASQYFLELFSGPSTLMADQEIRLDITYKDEMDQPQSASISKGINAILGAEGDNIKAAAAVTTLAELINGNLTCNTVLSSQLYNSPVQHEVYISYRQHIDTFCNL